MTAEDDEIKAKIGLLAGHINRHKNNQTAATPYARPQSYPQSQPGGAYQYPVSSSATWHRGRGNGFAPRGYGRGGRGGRGGAPIHRHNTLVLNTNTPTTPNTGYTASYSAATPNGSSFAQNENIPASASSRHLQWINPALQDKHSQERAKALEATKIMNLQKKDEQEKNRILKHSKRFEIIVEGIRFQVTKDGSKLVKISGDETFSRTTPKKAIIAGVKFNRSKNGNLYRARTVRAQRGNGVVRKVDKPCRNFTNTGSCSKGDICQYTHDPTKVAVCSDFLQKGECDAGDACDLSHELSPERTPACLYFARGRCSNEDCRYSHVRVSPSAPVCHDFGVYGYCEKGDECTESHVRECPAFSNTGSCKDTRCKLPHRLKASVIRRNTAREEAAGEDDASDLSSDEDEEEYDSDDVDSVVMDEYFGKGPQDTDVSMQQDYVQF